MIIVFVNYIVNYSSQSNGKSVCVDGNCSWCIFYRYWHSDCLRNVMKISFLNLIMKKICPLHTDIYLIHTETPDGTIKDYCPRCQNLFGEKI